VKESLTEEESPLIGAQQHEPRGAAHLTLRRFWLTLAIFGVGLLLIIFLAPLVGSTKIDLRKVLDRSLPLRDNPDATIFFLTRLPRVLLACLVGAALACAGAVFQALLRNPLATPYILGVSSGSALGVVLAIKLRLDAVMLRGDAETNLLLVAGILVTFLFMFSLVRMKRRILWSCLLLGGVTLYFFGYMLSAVAVWRWGARPLPPLSVTFLVGFAGAYAAVALVYFLARTKTGISTSTLLLAGVTLNFFFSAMILLVQYLSDPGQSFQMIRWMMGGVDVASYAPILQVLPIVLVGLIVLYSQARKLNLISLDIHAAAQMGVDTENTQKLLYFASSLLVAGVVSVAGPIGFVGLIVPHMIRLLIGADHRLLLPASALFGGAFLIVCDTIARTAFAPTEIPVGVITAFCGAPFFIALLLKRRAF
jgi:ABC-type Fe3+-siderophore transport system permease subunit